MTDEILSVLRSQDLCVLATEALGQPHTSLMACLFDEPGSRVILATGTHTKKCRNVRANPRVSLLFDTRSVNGQARQDTQALTVTGRVEFFEDDAWRRRFAEVHEHLADFLADSDTVLMAVSVASILVAHGPTDTEFTVLDPT